MGKVYRKITFRCFTDLIHTWKQMLTCQHDTSVSMYESAVNSNCFTKTNNMVFYIEGGL